MPIKYNPASPKRTTKHEGAVRAGEHREQHSAVAQAGRDPWGDTQPAAGLTAPLTKGTYGS